MDYTLILQNIGRHIQLDASEEQFFCSLLKSATIRRKEFLLRAGEICRYENFIHKGCLRTYALDKYGNEHIAMFAIEDWWTGDMYSFLTQQPGQYYIDAVEDTEIWQISKPDLEQLYVKIPKFERFFRILLQNAFIAQQQRIVQNLSFTAEQRYHAFIAQYPKLEQRLTQRQMAAFLGITPEFLSMLRRKAANK